MLTDNIKRLMSINKITAKELSKKVGVTPTHISYILNNKREPSIDLLNKIAQVLDVSVDEFFSIKQSDKFYASSKNKLDNEKKKQIDTIAAHLEEKNLTPQKLKLLNDYIDLLFNENF